MARGRPAARGGARRPSRLEASWSKAAVAGEPCVWWRRIRVELGRREEIRRRAINQIWTPSVIFFLCICNHKCPLSRKAAMDI